MPISTGYKIEAYTLAYFVSDPVNCGLDISRSRLVTATGVFLLVRSSLHEVVNELLLALLVEIL